MVKRFFSATSVVSLLIMVGMIVGVGCKKKDGGKAPAKAGSGAKGSSTKGSETKKDIQVAFVTNNASNFWSIARKGVEKAEKETGATVEFRIPANGTAAEQQGIVEDLIAKGCQGIAISPVDPVNQTPMLNTAAKELIVICHDSDAPDSDRRCYIGTNNYSAGIQAGKLIKEVLPDGGKIMIFVGTLDAQNARDRRQGILDEIQGSMVEVIDTRTDNTDRTRAKSNVEDTLVNHPDVGCLVGLWSYNGPTIAAAVKDAKKAGKVNVVCFDEDEATLQAIQDGVIYGTVVQKPFEFGYQSIKTLASLVEGDESKIPENGIIDTGVTIVKSENIEEFWTELKRLVK